MFTGIVEEVGKSPLYSVEWEFRGIGGEGSKSTGRYENRRQYCGKWSMSDSHFPAAGRIYCRCDGRDDQKKQSWKL